MQLNKRRKVVVLLLVAAVAFGVYRFYGKKPADATQLRVSGNIETTTVGVGFKIPGHVTARLVSEGDVIRQGQAVAQLETADLTLAVAQARAERAAAAANLAELRHGSRQQEVAAAQAVVRRAAADKDNAAVENQRMQALYAMAAIPARERDRADTAYADASARYDEAAQQLQLVQEGPRQEQIDAAAARLQQAEEQVKLAETRLAYAQITSPVDGVVLSENIQPGEYVSPGTPVVTVGDLGHVWLKAYVSETDLGRVKLGQKVNITTDTYPGKVYPGYISFISSEAEFTPKTIQTPQERVKLVYRIKINIDNAAQELKPGMPADGVILTEGE